VKSRDWPFFLFFSRGGAKRSLETRMEWGFFGKAHLMNITESFQFFVMIY